MAFFLLHDILGALAYPDYNWVTQDMTMLTTLDAPSYAVASGYRAVSGLFGCTCCMAMCLFLQQKDNKPLRWGVYLYSLCHWWYTIGRILLLYRTNLLMGDLAESVYLYGVMVPTMFLYTISWIIIFAGGVRADKAAKRLAWCAVIIPILALVGVYFSGPVPDTNQFGLMMRSGYYAPVLFVAILGIYGFYLPDTGPQKVDLGE